MKVSTFKHTGVLEDGRFINKRGSVHATGGITLCEINGGCGIPTCQTCDPGYWLCVSAPRTRNGIVRGISIKFDSKEEMDLMFKNRGMHI